MDPYHAKTITVLIGCLVELKECNSMCDKKYLKYK